MHFLKNDWLLCEEGVGRRKACEETSEKCSVAACAGGAGGSAQNGSEDEGKWRGVWRLNKSGDRLVVGSEGTEDIKDTLGS